MPKVKIEYKVKYGIESFKDHIPRSICRKIVGDGEYLIEHCNASKRWTARSDLIGYWIGSPGGDYFSGPEGEDMPIEFIEKWEINWE